jgi:transcription elongation factor GreA-like protein
MNPDTLKTIVSLLNEEKWTRETINNYSLKSFKQLNSIIDNAKGKGEEEAIRNTCEEYLHHTPHSIHAMYIIGRMELEQDKSEGGQLQKLIELFSKSKRYSLVEYLANEILTYGENVAALEALVTSYQFSNNNDKLISIWERLVKVNRDDAGLAYKLGTVKEQHHMQDEAVRYYKTALLRFLKKGKKKRIDELWRKLAELIPEDLSHFLNLERII